MVLRVPYFDVVERYVVGYMTSIKSLVVLPVHETAVLLLHPWKTNPPIQNWSSQELNVLRPDIRMARLAVDSRVPLNNRHFPRIVCKGDPVCRSPASS